MVVLAGFEIGIAAVVVDVTAAREAEDVVMARRHARDRVRTVTIGPRGERAVMIGRDDDRAGDGFPGRDDAARDRRGIGGIGVRGRRGRREQHGDEERTCHGFLSESRARYAVRTATSRGRRCPGTAVARCRRRLAYDRRRATNVRSGPIVEFRVGVWQIAHSCAKRARPRATETVSVAAAAYVAGTGTGRPAPPGSELRATSATTTALR